jgi:prefoldin subunit 5|tara:strand:- start:3281 stop:3487 length:207 start_codon:yes stop_codon:yes gene_type:complete
MKIEKLKEVLENYSTVSNKDLSEVMVFLKSRFELTKKSVLEMTHQLDELERDYNKLNDELKRRITPNG